MMAKNQRAPRRRYSLLQRAGRFALPPGATPSPRQRSAGRGAQAWWQTGETAAVRHGGLLSPPLSSKGGEGDRLVGCWECQVPHRVGKRISITRAGQIEAEAV